MSLRADLQIIVRQVRPLLVGGALVLVPALYLLSGFYSVGTEERGVVMRFGRVVHDQVLPGMHYHWPWPVESVTTLPATTLQSLEIDLPASAPEALQAELTTGDEDLVEVALQVQYNISEPGQYLAASEAPKTLLRELVTAKTIAYVGSNAIDPLLTTGRAQFQNALQAEVQQSLNDWELGLRITSVQIRRLEPPASIKDAFDDVARARSEKQKLIQDSAGERNTRLAQARSEASQIRARAEAEATESRESARGVLQRFQANEAALRQNPKLIRERLYLERLEETLSEPQLIIIPDVSP